MCGEELVYEDTEEFQFPESESIKYLLDSDSNPDVGLILVLDISYSAIQQNCIEFYRKLFQSLPKQSMLCCQVILYNSQIHLLNLNDVQIVSLPQTDWQILEALRYEITNFTSISRVKQFI